MEPIVYVAAAAVVLVLLVLLVLLKKFTSEDSQNAAPLEAEAAEGRGAARNRGAVAGVRRRGPRGSRLAEARRQGAEESDEGEAEAGGVPLDLPDEKIGAKKLRKLQDKAEKRAQREAELQEREDRKRREALRDEQRQKDEAQEEAEEAARLEEENKRKAEEEKREYEEYLKLKEAFTVEEEGTNEAELNGDSESILQEFINYIKDMKVVMLEDLAAHFKLKTQDAIDRVTTLRDEGRLTGVLDDRGKFIYITEDEYESVAKFIRQRGRVSITELAESSNKLINLHPDNQETMHKKLVGEAAA